MDQPSVPENVLGAPTEGLGQTVTFAFNPNGAPPQKTVQASSGPRVGNTSGGARGNLSSTDVRLDPGPADPTATLLMKAGSEVLAKKMDEARTLEFVKGMQRSMSGEALVEIKESQPWYSRVFGDTPMVEGARAYSAQDAVNRTIAHETANVKNVETLDSESAAKHYANVLARAQTGDGTTDALVMKGMLEQMPGLMKAQAKQHYAYGQRTASKKMYDSIVSGAGALQETGQLYAEGKLTDKDMEVRAQGFVANALPPAGIDEESYQKTLTSAIRSMADTGQFHAVEALRKTGVMKALTPEQSTALDKAIEGAATRGRDKYAFKYSGMMAEIQSDAAHPPVGQTPRVLSDRIDRANEAFQKLTGSPIGLFSSDQKSSLLGRNFDALKAEQDKATARSEVLNDKATTALQKAAAKTEQEKIVSTYVANGDIEMAKKLDGVTSDDVDLQVYSKVKNAIQSGQPAEAAEYLKQVYVKGHVSKQLAAEFQAPLRQAQAEFSQGNSSPSDAWYKTVNTYRQMEQVGGWAYAQAYFGDQAKMLSYASRRLGPDLFGPNSGEVYIAAMTKQRDGFTSEKLKAKDQAALISKVANAGSSWLPGFISKGDTIRPDAVRQLTETIGEAVAEWKDGPGMTDEEATARALNDYLGAQADGGYTGGVGGELLGGFYIQRQPGATNTSLATVMMGEGKNVTNVPAERKGEIFTKFLVSKGTDVDGTVNIRRMEDVAGTPNFVVTTNRKDGSTGTVRFNGSELAAYSAEATKWLRLGSNGYRKITEEETGAYNADMKRRAATDYKPVQLQYGSPVNYTPDQYAQGVAIVRQQLADRNKLQSK